MGVNGVQRFTVNRRTFSRAVGMAIAAAAAGLPVATVAQGATPAVAPASGGIAGMLAMAPASYPWVDEPENLIISYADIATQLEVTGVERPDSMDDASFPLWTAAIFGLALPVTSAQYLQFWREDYGFDLFQTDETLWLSLPPFDLSLFRGRFDHDAIRATLTANGYRPVDVAGHEILTLREDYVHDVASDFAYKLAAMNHVALLEDGTIACSSVQAALAAVLDVAAGTAPSLMDQGEIATLVEHAPADLVSGIIIDGGALAAVPLPGSSSGEPGATPAFAWDTTDVTGTDELPPVTMALIGATAGGPLVGQGIETPAGVPDARAVAVTLMETPEAAEEAVPIVDARLATGESIYSGRSYSDFFAGWTVQVVPAAPVLIVELALGPETAPDILFGMLNRRDLGFLAW